MSDTVIRYDYLLRRVVTEDANLPSSAVRGPASAVDGAVMLFDGDTGKIAKMGSLVADPLGALFQLCADGAVGDGWNVQKNGFWSEADADCDSGFVHSVNGIPRFVEQTYRGEDGQFWYLYTPEAKQNPLTVSDGGRVGINKPTNLVNYHTSYVNPSTGALNDMDAAGTYTRPFNTLYEVSIAATGAPDQYHFRVSTDDGATWGAYSTPAPCLTTFTAIDAFGVQIVFENSTGHNTDDAWLFTAFSQLPGAALSVNPTMFVEVNNTTDGTVASPEWNDITFDMANLSTPSITFLPIGVGEGGSTKGMVYFGCHRKFNSVFIDITTEAIGATILYEYWNGSTWTLITGLQGLLDQTFGLTRSGQVRWDKNLMAGWAKSLLPGKAPEDDGYTLYWVRVRSTTVMTQAPEADLTTPQGNTRFAVYPGHLSSLPTFSLDGLGRATIRKKSGTEGGAFIVANLDEPSFRATVEVEASDTSYNLYKEAYDDNHRMFYGYGHLDFWTIGNNAVLRHKFDQDIDFYNKMDNLLLKLDRTGVITAGAVGYEALVLHDNDIPNKKYVDGLGGGLILQGDWNAATNTPDISATTTTGYAWNVAVAGSTNLGGITNWTVGSLAVKTVAGWSKVGGTPTVWGAITGTLSSQGDLQSALNAKVSSSTLATWAGTEYITTLGAVTSGSWTADRINKNYLDTALTAQGNTFNGPLELIQATNEGKYPALNGALITGLDAIALMLVGDQTAAGAKTFSGALTASAGINIPTGQTYKINNVALTYTDVNADPSGAAAAVQSNLGTHAGLTGASVHGLGTASTHAATDFATAAQGSSADSAYAAAVTNATNANTASTLVKRDGSGNFSAGTITANLTGNASGSSGSCTGNAATVTGFSPATGKVLTLSKTITLTSPDDTSVATLPAGAKTLLATDGSANSLTNFPTLNQDTTGSAAYLKAVATTGKISLTGPTAGQTRAKTVRDADDTILELGGSYTPSGTWTSMTLVTPALGTPASGNLANCAFPTLNQDTTGTAAKATNMKGGNSTTLLGAIGYQSDVDATTLLGPNTTALKKFLRMTGTGTNGAAPAWDQVTDVVWPVTTKTAAYPITAADSVIICDTTSAAFTVTLPTAVNAAGKIYWIKRVSAGTNRLTIATTSSQTIDGLTTALVDSQYVSLTLVSDGANWYII